MTIRQRIGLLVPGARERRRQIAAFGEVWRQGNDAAATGSGRLWAVLGDSTAQAIGASRPDYGYVGQVRTWLDQRGEAAWRVVNLSRSGATSADVVAEQLAALAELASPDLVSCAVGANDLLRPSEPLASSLRSIAAALPPGSLLANLPRGLREGKAARINALIAELAEAHDLHVVDLWSATGPPWGGKFSADHFHPNDNGYRAWADAFIAAIEH